MLQKYDRRMCRHLAKISSIIFCHNRSNFESPVFRLSKSHRITRVGTEGIFSNCQQVKSCILFSKPWYLFWKKIKKCNNLYFDISIGQTYYLFRIHPSAISLLFIVHFQINITKLQCEILVGTSCKLCVY